MRKVRFRALITLDPAEAHPGTPLHPAPGAYPNRTHSLLVRAAHPCIPGHNWFFAAEICWDGEQPLRPGDRALVTISVAGDQAGTFFGAGSHFTLWSGGDVGHGTVSRRVYTDYTPS